MKTWPKISIIIPVYNVEQYITECLQSVMNQTYTGRIECILVDDCGGDYSIGLAQQVIADYYGNIDFRIIHHEHNQGLSAARNTGTEAATGDYIYYLDSDDYLSNDCIELLTKPLLEREYDMVMGDYQMFGERQDSSLLQETRDEIIGNEGIFASYADRKIYVMAWNKLCRTSFLRDNGITFLEGQLHEDELWTYKTMLCIQAIRVVHIQSYFYRVRMNSIATEKSKGVQKLLSYQDTIEYIQNHQYCKEVEYHKCLFYYWNLYLSIAFGDNLSFRKSYLQLRKSCHYNPVKQYICDRKSRKQFSNAHLAMPPIVAYCYLQIRYGKKQR